MKTEIKNLINQRLEQKNISQNQFSKILGISNATLNYILNDNWEKVSDEMINKIYVQLKPQDLKIVKTINFQTVWENCTIARTHKKMIAITGTEGAGKTVAVSEYGKNHQNTYVVTCQNSMRPKQLFLEIVKAMGLNNNSNVYDLIQFLANEINKKENPVIIIDEVSLLNHTTLMYLKDLWDRINCGLVLVGVDYFKTNLIKAVEKNKIGMPEFFSRVNLWVELSKPKRNEIEFICRENSITDDETIKSLYWVNNFRILGNTISNINLNLI